MPVSGEVKTIYSDAARQNAVFPRTKVNAITDANDAPLSSLLGSKQEALVSGTNIKTINGNSILGSGNIVTPIGPSYTAGNGIDINVYDQISADTTVLATKSEVNAKQDILTAGDGITITSDTISADTSVLATQSDLSSKQDTLVSGTNIKTVNSTSLLGSGNIAVQPVLTAGNGIVLSGNTIVNRFANLSNVDLNTIRYNCQAYIGDSCTNKPTTNGGMFICTMGSNDGTYGAQLFITYATTGQGVYYRRFNGSATPTAWVKLISSEGGSVETLTTTGAMTAQSLQIKSGTNQSSPPYFLCLNNSFSEGGNVGYVTKSNMLAAINGTYNAGETFTIGGNYQIFACYIYAPTNYNNVRFFIPTDKPITASTVTCSKLTMTLQTAKNAQGNFLINNIDVKATSGYTITCTARGSGIYVDLKCPTSISLTNRDIGTVILGSSTFTFA